MKIREIPSWILAVIVALYVTPFVLRDVIKKNPALKAEYERLNKKMLIGCLFFTIVIMIFLYS
jgi:hypothetical protein